jgi:hypothetical protein
MKNKIFWALSILILSALACNLPFTNDGQSDVSLPDPDADSFSANVQDESVLEPVSLSSAQRQMLAVYGLPNRFMILFSEDMREETWFFDHLGYAITFRNGDIYTENENDPVEGTVPISVYYPWQFNGQMGLSELLAVSQSESFAVESLDEVFQDDVSLVYMKGLDAGFREDQILFVRAIPVGAGAIDSKEDAEAIESVVGTTLTPEEQAHTGTHSYDTSCIYSDGYSENFSEDETWEFTEEGVYSNGEGPFPKISDNYYGIQDEFGDFFIMFSSDTITINGTFIDEDDEGEAETIVFSCVQILE